MTRQQALDVLEAVGGQERLIAGISHGPPAVDQATEAHITKLMADAHVSTSPYADIESPRTRTRGNPQGAKYGWEP